MASGVGKVLRTKCGMWWVFGFFLVDRHVSGRLV